MTGAGWLKAMKVQGTEGERAYRLRADQIVWRLGDGSVPADPVFKPNARGTARKANLYFRELYETAQYGAESVRKSIPARSTRSCARSGKASSSPESWPRCSALRRWNSASTSPTSSVVHMRNVPPNPANYAQRSGRAGRSGQPALVFTSCSRQSAHDTHYFDDRNGMVSGSVTAPRLDLRNEDLLRCHFNALYLRSPESRGSRTAISTMFSTSTIRASAQGGTQGLVRQRAGLRRGRCCRMGASRR